jgi:hypothetical protein
VVTVPSHRTDAGESYQNTHAGWWGGGHRSRSVTQGQTLSCSPLPGGSCPSYERQMMHSEVTLPPRAVKNEGLKGAGSVSGAQWTF